MYTKEQKLKVLHYVLGVYEKTLKSLVKANKARQEKIMSDLSYSTNGFIGNKDLDFGICLFLKGDKYSIFRYIYVIDFQKESRYSICKYPNQCKTYKEVKQTFRDRISWLKQAINHYDNQR